MSDLSLLDPTTDIDKFGDHFINEAKESGLLNSVTIAFLGFNETYLSLLGPDRSDGIYCVVPMIMSSSQAGVKRFVARVQGIAGPGHTVSGSTLTHYNALRALWLGVNRLTESGLCLVQPIGFI